MNMVSFRIITYNLNVWDVFFHNRYLSYWGLFYLTKRMKYDETVADCVKNKEHVKVYNEHKSGNLVISWFLTPR